MIDSVIARVERLCFTYNPALNLDSGGQAPTFVYVIFFTLFVLFNTFAINMWLQYRRRGRWANPVHAERVYLWLSLIAKSVLAWQVYGGALAGS